MSLPGQDHADAFLALARAATGSPSLVVYDGSVDAGATAPYAVAYFAFERPDGTVMPDWISLTLTSSVIRVVATVHGVGDLPEASKAARAVAGRFQAAVLDKTLTVSGWSCTPIRWLEGGLPQRNEDVPGSTIVSQVDTYVWTAVPA